MPFKRIPPLQDEVSSWTPGDSSDKSKEVRQPESIQSSMRTFASGATRQADTDKLDFDGFLSTSVLKRYAEYMHLHRFQADGIIRDSDNWQKGIDRKVYRKSMWRHFFDCWAGLRKVKCEENDLKLENDLCALIFNASGVLHEILLRRDTGVI